MAFSNERKVSELERVRWVDRWINLRKTNKKKLLFNIFQFGYISKSGGWEVGKNTLNKHRSLRILLYMTYWSNPTCVKTPNPLEQNKKKLVLGATKSVRLGIARLWFYLI